MDDWLYDQPVLVIALDLPYKGTNLAAKQLSCFIAEIPVKQFKYDLSVAVFLCGLEGCLIEAYHHLAANYKVVPVLSSLIYLK